MARTYNTSDQEMISSINITPLVDVLLVLLVILIISAPYLSQEGIELSLPQTASVQELPPNATDATVAVSSKGVIYLNAKKISLLELRQQLQKLAKRNNFTLFFEADKSVSYAIIVKVLSEIQASGISEIGLVALPE